MVANQVLWEEMLDEFRALGGTAENIRLGQGPYGRGLFPVDPRKPYRILIPPSLLVHAKHVQFVDGDFRIGPEANIGEREKAFLENYEREFSWGVAQSETQELLEMMRNAPAGLKELLRSPFNLDVWLTESTPEWIQKRFIDARVIALEDKTPAVMPIVELINHAPGTTYEIDERGVGVSGQTSGEILVAYLPDDALGIFAGWGFVSEAEPFALSLSLKVDRIRIKITRRLGGPTPFLPEVTRDGKELHLSYLLLGHKTYPRLAKGIFHKIMRDAGRRDEAVEAFDAIQHVNRRFWLQLLQASEEAELPLGRLLRRLIHAQLSAMSHSIGVRHV